jgi:lycopene cyclase domain-containing protein
MTSYGIILLSTLFFPLILSFDRKVKFFRSWKKAIFSSFIVSLPFITWDVIAAGKGDWGFDPSQSGTFRILGLPLEEICFFFAVPFAVLFIFECLRVWLIAGTIAFLTWPRFYTSTVFILFAVFFLLLAGPWKNFTGSRFFWLTQGLCLIPFIIINGFLTGIPVIWYSNSAILGWRVLSIPVEDFFYSFILAGTNLIVFQALSSFKFFKVRTEISEVSKEGKFYG